MRGLITGVALLAALALAGPPAQARSLQIEVRSTRADLVSDGQALTTIVLPARAHGLKVTLNGKRVRGFARQPDDAADERSLLLQGLRLGRNRVVASVRGHRAVQLTVTNHPAGGPLFGGPQVQPWHCQQSARDAQCNQPPFYTYLYKSSDPTKVGLHPYDRADPPSDVATTTTDQGVRVPFIVRQETGYLARDQYRILVLVDPQRGWDRWEPQRTWNHKLLVPGGGGCGADYGPRSAPLQDFSGTLPAVPLLREDSYVNALGRGFAVMSTALANTGHNCNVATEAEALIMTKERVIEQYGDVRYTIGSGCSGGSVVAQTVANAYPGAVYDGLIVTCSYPDTFTAGAQFADSHLMRLYFEDPSRWGPGVVWSPTQWGEVEGHITHVNAVVADEGLLKGALEPEGDCDPNSYNPQTNPTGVRCDVLDQMTNVLGPRSREVWSAAEQRAGHGFVSLPFSNVGVQYGLQTLREGKITPEQFVDLNEKIGGLDVDAGFTPQRLAGDDRTIANAYRSGLVNEGDHLDTVPIIAHGGPDPAFGHDFSHTWWMRDRLDHVQGHHANHVLWVGAVPVFGGLDWPTEALVAMDRWLAAVEADHSSRPLARKILVDKPASVHDRCQYTPYVHLSALDKTCLPDALHLRLGTSREVAGGNRLNDTLKCRLRPLNRADYDPVGLSDAQYARLQKVFPDGVCDWSQPGVGQQPAIAWQTYQDAKGRVIYGGRAMPAPPRSHVVPRRRR